MFLLLRRILIFFCCIITTISCNHSSSFQEPSGNEKGTLILKSRACYFADADSIEQQTQIKIDTPSCREIEQIKSIMEYIGLPQNFKIYRGNIDNALATVVNNNRLIIYNKDLFTAMDEINSSYWTSLFIIAHEIGHHLADNISDTSNVLSAELDADKFAGFLLYRMGVDSNQVIGAVASNLISAEQDSETHPSKEKRLEAVKKSWMESYNLRFMSAIPPVINDHFTEAIGTAFEKEQAGFSNENFIYNDLILNKWRSERTENDFEENLDFYDERYTQYIQKNTFRFKGIITDVEKMNVNTNLNQPYLLKVEILITELSSRSTLPDIVINQKHMFFVQYHPLVRYDRLKDFYDFFIGGRFMYFDVLELKNDTFYILKAYANKQQTL